MKRFGFSFVFIVLAVSLSSRLCQAQIVPFKAFGKQNVYNPATGVYEGTAIASYCGRCQVNGFAIPSPTADPNVLNWTGGGPLTAADGSQIQLAGGGKVQLIPLGGTLYSAIWFGEFNVVGGTGRFANVGPGPKPIFVIAVNYPFDIVNSPEWVFDFTLLGKIDLGRGN